VESGGAVALGLARERASLCLVGPNLDALQDLSKNVLDKARSVRIYRTDLNLRLDKDVTSFQSVFWVISKI
jgi:hypothetical protein